MEIGNFLGAIDWDIFYSDIQKKIEEINININNSPNKIGILFIEGFLLFSPLLSNPNENNNYLNLFDYYIYIYAWINLLQKKEE